MAPPAKTFQAAFQLSCAPVPVTLLYPRNRQLSPRVRAFIDWTMRLFGRA